MQIFLKLVDGLKDNLKIDISCYQPSFIKKAVHFYAKKHKLEFKDAIEQIITKKEVAYDFIQQNILINTSEMFRNSDRFRYIKDVVLPKLSTYAFIRIWSLGCSYGQEAYSLAILLKEQNLLHRSIIYATDVDIEAIEGAKKGCYSLDKAFKYCENYYLSGNCNHFSQYFDIKYGKFCIKEEFKRHIHFFEHDIFHDSLFNTFHLILCRNLLYYFNQDIRKKIIDKISKSLEYGGFLITD